MNKFKNKKTIHNGIEFDSKKERDCWIALSNSERLGEIENLRRQERYLLIPKQPGERAVHYVADMAYYDRVTDSEVVVDVKSPFTRKLPVYVLKRKLMLYVHGIKVVEL